MALTGPPVIAAGAVIMTLADPVLETDTGVKVSYDKSAAAAGSRLRDKAGNEVASLTNRAVDPTDTTQPRLVRAEVDGDVLTIYFSEPLDEDFRRDANLFRVGLIWQSGSPSFGRCGDYRTTFTIFNPRELYVVGNTVVVDGLTQSATTRAPTAWTIAKFPGYYAKITAPAEHRLRDLSGNLVSTPEYHNEQYLKTRDLISIPNLTTLPFAGARHGVRQTS